MSGLSPIGSQIFRAKYLPPEGRPSGWRSLPPEINTPLALAVEAYLFRDRIMFKTGQLGYLRDYLQYYARAPYWSLKGNYYLREIGQLRNFAPEIGSAADVTVWLKMARNIGWRPL